MKTYSLYELNEFLRRVVALNFTESIWVTAEIGQINESRGHRFLSLLEKEGEDIVAELSAVIWTADFKRIQRTLGGHIGDILANGVEVRLRGRVDFHERYGLKFVIEDVDPTFTIGKLEFERQQLIASLKAEGLLKLNKQRRLPRVLQRLAVISSETAAGWEDFRSHLEENSFRYDFGIHLFAAAMQGIFVEKEVIRQLQAIEQRHADFDCVIIVRGGGAKLDLAAFDNAALCRAVADFPIPVLTGIGHETDSTAVDLVAYLSMKTPTAVADFVIGHNLAFESTIDELGKAIRLTIQNRLTIEDGELVRAKSIVTILSQSLLKHQHQELGEWRRRLAVVPPQIFKFEKTKIDNALKIMNLMSIETTMKRGFSITRRADGSILTDKEGVKKGDFIETEWENGHVKSRVV